VRFRPPLPGLLVLALLACGGVQAHAASPGGAVVTRWDGPIGPVTADYVTGEIERANRSGAGLFVLGLDTPGGLDTAMRDIVKAINSSSVPVVVWVGPSGSRAASAGCVIGLAAHLLVMAPGTNIGAAHPVSVGGGSMDSTMASKVEQDAGAYVEALARERGRNVEWARDAVVHSVSVAADRAVELGVADYLARDIPAVVEGAEGRTVTTAGGTITIALDDPNPVYREPGWRYRLLSLLDNPNVAYILLLMGIYGLFFELANPGALFPGIFGAISLVLGLYSLSNLDVNYAGLLLIVLGAVMLLLEIKVTSHGLLTVGGVAALLIGSLFLIDSPLPFFRVSLAVIIPAVAATALFFLFLVGKGILAQRRPPATGARSLVGLTATARSRIDPGGTVFLEGTHWNARSDEPIEAGEPVTVVDVQGLNLIVKRKA